MSIKDIILNVEQSMKKNHEEVPVIQYAENLSGSYLKKVINNFEIKDTEKVVAVVDTSLFKNSSKGFVFTDYAMHSIKFMKPCIYFSSENRWEIYSTEESCLEYKRIMYASIEENMENQCCLGLETIEMTSCFYNEKYNLFIMNVLNAIGELFNGSKGKVLLKNDQLVMNKNAYEKDKFSKIYPYIENLYNSFKYDCHKKEYNEDEVEDILAMATDETEAALNLFDAGYLDYVYKAYEYEPEDNLRALRRLASDLYDLCTNKEINYYIESLLKSAILLEVLGLENYIYLNELIVMCIDYISICEELDKDMKQPKVFITELYEKMIEHDLVIEGPENQIIKNYLGQHYFNKWCNRINRDDIKKAMSFECLEAYEAYINNAKTEFGYNCAYQYELIKMTRYLERDENVSNVYLDQAYVLFNNFDFEEVKEQLENAIEDGDYDVQAIAYYNLGVLEYNHLCFNSSNYEENAIEYFEKAYEYEYKKAGVMLAHILFSKGKYIDAYEYLKLEDIDLPLAYYYLEKMAREGLGIPVDISSANYYKEIFISYYK